MIELLMKTFAASIVVAIVFAVGAMYALDETWQRRADQAFVSPTSVRVPEHGNTHNLVGKDWYSSRDH